MGDFLATDALLSLTGEGRLIDALSHVSADPLLTTEAIDRVIALALARRGGNRVFFIGNGGSAGIASHMAADWMKAGGFAALSFNDAPAITSFANDLGYRHVFVEPLKKLAHPGDLLFAISSSGQSQNIIDAAVLAKDLGMHVVTLSGFRPENHLRRLGDINFHVPSERYGIVEVAHHAILHAILDRIADA